ncbi:MAG TPA: ABC transporter substrate-binding protein [Alphaproteobacteria bacterium]|nr:ABC transporter substrate-binding protein [Alphaproteobacteria bacterium]
MRSALEPGGASKPRWRRSTGRNLLARLMWLSAIWTACLALGGPIDLASAQGKPDGTMTWGLHFSLAPTYFDPAETTGIITPFKFLYALHDALVKPMPQGLLTPSLAESYTESPDGLAYEFKLREGVTFHNGDPLTAADVVFSFQRYKGAGAKLYREKIEAVEVVDAHRVRFRLREPWPDFLIFFGTPATGAGWIVPKKYVEQVGDDGFKQHPIGAGPYRFISHTPGVELVVEAYEGYWRKVPHVKRLVFKSVPEPTTRLAMLKTGEADIGYTFPGALAEEIRRDPKLTLTPVYPPTPFWLDFTEKWDPKSPWHDRRVRLAANYAIDRQAINEAETLGFSKLTGSIIPHRFPYALPLEPYPYDPGKARQLLGEAGYPNGFDAGDITPVPPWTAMAEAVAGYLGAVGIKVRVRSMERPAMLAAWRGKTLRGLILAASGANGNAATRLENYVVSWGEFAYGGFPDLDELFRQQARERDSKQREAQLHALQRLVYERVMFAPIYEITGLMGIGPRVAQSGLGLIDLYPWSGPYEDVQLK